MAADNLASQNEEIDDKAISIKFSSKISFKKNLKCNFQFNEFNWSIKMTQISAAKKLSNYTTEVSRFLEPNSLAKALKSIR